MRGWVRSGAGMLAVLVAAGCVASEQPGSAADTEADASPRREDVGGYLVRLDSESSDPGSFQVRAEEGGIRILTGPAGIAYRLQDTVSTGEYRAEATFVQHGAPPGYREAYGVFVGGRDLDSEELEYTYLLVRGTGDFMVKRRVGHTTETLVDWTPHASVDAVDADGDEPTNSVAIETVEGETLFLVNGMVVYRMPSPQVRPYGVAGLRVNHRLDVAVTSWTLDRYAPADPTL